MDLLKVVSLALGHACTLLCPFCANQIPATCDKRGNWFHADVIGRPMGHQCAAGPIRNANEPEIAGLIVRELSDQAQNSSPSEAH